MATSEVQISNMALSRLGEEPITSLTEDSKSGRACNQHYYPILDEILEGHDWVCARTPASLAASVSAPLYGWDYKYALPADPYCLRLLEVKDTDENDVSYKLVGRDIFTNEGDGLYISFTRRLTNPAEISPILAQCFALRMAYWMEPIFGDSITRRKSIGDELDTLLLKAKQAGALQDYVEDELENEDSTGNAEWLDYGR